MLSLQGYFGKQLIVPRDRIWPCHMFMSIWLKDQCLRTYNLKLGSAILYSLLLAERQNSKEFLIEINQSSCQNIFSRLQTSCKSQHFHYNLLFAFMITQTSSHQNKLYCNYFISKFSENILSSADWVLKAEVCGHIMNRFGPNMNLSLHNMINQQELYPGWVGGPQ